MRPCAYPLNKRAFTLIELLATIAIMAVLIVTALPYVADYTSWARTTSEERDAQVTAGAIARWIAIGAPVGTANPSGSWTAAGGAYMRYPASAWTHGSSPAVIITSLASAGYTITGTNFKSMFMAPNTSWTALGARIKIGFTSTTNYTVTARSH